ncbi:transglutaminase family protein [Chromobacterium piscinae]|uniref:transglutaminase family protein n=1 Tax=Chromobacterium piscinae TaxID=686831 RepID=UPI003F80E79A
MTAAAVSEPNRWPVLLALLWIVSPLAWHLPFWLPAGCALALLWRGWRPALPPRWLLLPALPMAAAALWMSLGTLVGREGGVALLTMLIAFKAFETRTLRDWRVLTALGFFLAATPLLFDQSPLMAAWLALAMLLLTWAAARLAGALPRGSWRHAWQALALSLPLMLALFVAMPRLPQPLWSLNTPPQTASSGLGDDMEPGSISRLILNREPAFSAVFDGAAPRQDQLYWRVALLDDFDGRRWQGLGGERDERDEPAAGRVLRYRLTLRADRGRLPALEQAFGAGPGSRLEGGGLLRQEPRSDELLGYAQEGRQGERRRVVLSPARRAFYLRLPPGNSQSRALAVQLAAAGGDGRGFLRAALDFLKRGGFRYTLQQPLLGDQAVDHFLFASRQGFCEHYASSFAFLARAAGFPARVVVGYQGGEYNPVGRFWQLRSSDAHAWVEVWLDGAWQRVDPTAAVSPGRLALGAEQTLPALRTESGMAAALPSQWLRRVRQQWFAANFVWQQWVVGYDAERQQGLFRWLGLGERVDSASVLRALAAGMALAMMPLALWWRGRPVEEPLPAGWEALRRRLEKRGVEAPRAQGPLERLKAARGLPRDDFNRLKALVDEYIGLRYRLTAADGAREKRWLRRARRWK